MSIGTQTVGGPRDRKREESKLRKVGLIVKDLEAILTQMTIFKQSVAARMIPSAVEVCIALGISPEELRQK